MTRLNLKTVRAYHIRENFQEIYKEEAREGFEGTLKKKMVFLGNPQSN